VPNPRAGGDELVQVFLDKGISPEELAALLGAHSTSKQFEFDPSKSGAALDTTPGVWDVVCIFLLLLLLPSSKWAESVGLAV
jgi:hypothetical protein